MSSWRRCIVNLFAMAFFGIASVRSASNAFAADMNITLAPDKEPAMGILIHGVIEEGDSAKFRAAVADASTSPRSPHAGSRTGLSRWSCI